MVDQVPLVELSDSLGQYLDRLLDTDHPHYQECVDNVQSIGDSLRRWGFVSLSSHGVDQRCLEEAYQAARLAFHLTEAQKRRYEDVEGGRQRGYTPLLMERAKGQSLGDLKEFWHIGRELSDDHTYRATGVMKSNLFPREVPEFQSSMLTLYSAMDQLAHQMLRVIEHYLEIPDGALDALASEGNSVLRVLNYPELERFQSREAGSVRAAAHEDINLLTLLPAATQPGLQLLTRQGDWLDIVPPAGAIILDTGDMMNVITGGALPATTHRVVNPPGESTEARLSMPFFMHPRPDARLIPLGRHSGDQEIEGLGLTAIEFLSRRLSENGLV